MIHNGLYHYLRSATLIILNIYPLFDRITGKVQPVTGAWSSISQPFLRQAQGTAEELMTNALSLNPRFVGRP